MPVSDASGEPDREPDLVPTRRGRRERAAADALHGLIRELAIKQFPSASSETPIELDLQLQVDPRQDWEVEFSGGVVEQLFPQIEQALSNESAYQEGAVFHFREGTSRHPDARPPRADMVFAGYGALGKPRWETFNEESDGTKVRIQTGRELRSEQLSSCGRASHEYAILGQVTFGNLHLPEAYRDAAGASELAFTFQAVEIRDTRGKFGLRLNTLVGGLLPDEVLDLLQEPGWQWMGDLREACLGALEAVQEEAVQARRSKEASAFQAAMRKVPRVLSQFAEGLELGYLDG